MAKQWLRAPADSYFLSHILIICFILLRSSSFIRKGVLFYCDRQVSYGRVFYFTAVVKFHTEGCFILQRSSSFIRKGVLFYSGRQVPYGRVFYFTAIVKFHRVFFTAIVKSHTEGCFIFLRSSSFMRKGVLFSCDRQASSRRAYNSRTAMKANILQRASHIADGEGKELGDTFW
jgi:hypothetical protein